MSWIHKLHETYENCQSMIGKTAPKEILLPICHTTRMAQIEIAIDHQGIFKTARVVPKEDAKTIIPCTESSSGRTSGGTPHPLCDKLQYIADDYGKFGGEKESFFELEPSDYTKNDLKNEYFKGECKNNQYHLINEMLAVRRKRLSACELLNELIEIPNLTRLINDNRGVSDIQTGTVDMATRVINKYKLIEIFPLTLEKTITYEYVLAQWCNSSFGNAKAKAILAYVKKGCVAKDLVKEKVLFAGSDGKLLKKRDGKKQNKNVTDIFDVLPGRLNKKGEIENWQADAFIRWEVWSPNDQCVKVPEDKALWESWIKYYSNTKKSKTLCYVTGKELLAADQHPAKLRNDGDKAKLISSNDTSGFTFRGRFEDAAQACGVGFEATQKAHGALSWLISKQGKVFYMKGAGGKTGPGLAVVAWATSGKQIPDPIADPLAILGEELASDDSDVVWTAQNIAHKFNKKIAGYKADLGDTSNVVVMGLDSATQGRMAIIFYRELSGLDFLKMVEQWHETCAWIHDYGYNKEKKKRIQFVGAPAPNDIAWAAYARRLKEDGQLEVESKTLKMTVERLLPCIIDGQQIPIDIVRSVVDHACNRYRFKENWEWNKTLSIACALFRKLNEKEDYSMALDESRKTRDYLYGRLLAAADCLERFALFTSEKKRDTNAARLMQRFADRPCSTWKTIELSLIPYKARLGGRAKKYQDVIDKAMCMFDPVEDFTSDKPLCGEFLLGYHCQREDLKPKRDEPKSIDDENLVEE